MSNASFRNIVTDSSGLIHEFLYINKRQEEPVCGFLSQSNYPSLSALSARPADDSVSNTFWEINSFLLKCLNNYSDIKVNCLICIAIEAYR